MLTTTTRAHPSTVYLHLVVSIQLLNRHQGIIMQNCLFTYSTNCDIMALPSCRGFPRTSGMFEEALMAATRTATWTRFGRFVCCRVSSRLA